MTNSVVPFDNDPRDDDAGESPDGEHRHDTRRERQRVYSRQACLEMLSQLPGLIKAGFMMPTEANSITRALQAILTEHRNATTESTSPQAIPRKLLDYAREHPELQTWFEPLMSDAEVTSLFENQ